MNTNLKRELKLICDKHELELEFKMIDFEYKIKQIYKPITESYGVRRDIPKHGASNRESILD